MATYEFVPELGHQLDAPLATEADKAAAQLKVRLEVLGLTNDHFQVSVENGRVIVTGDAAIQEQKEKILLALGNVAGVSEVEDRVDVGQEGITPRFVTVREGESLADLAERVYGDTEATGKLLKANHPLLTCPEDAFEGLVLRAPH
ncbi:BON domain-containing protein [Streptomyces sp. NPDC059785]|uniref:BON domain-containing protein n=1 Tax=unclassified Streptomyces TaxID=2593676 RepID=UPI0036601F5E